MSLPPGFEGFLPHMVELRGRLLVAIGTLAAAIVVSFAFAEKIINLLSQPIGGVENLQSIQVTENISVYMRISVLGGLILASPMILYQLLAFIHPGLESPQEKRLLYLGVASATVLFLGGVAFAYFIMLPSAIPVLTNFLEIPNRPRPQDYFNFVTGLLFWMGIGFETPILVFLLAKLKLVTPRSLAKHWRIAVLVIAVLAGLITPTVDPISMALLMAPLLVLYALSVLVSYLAVKE